MQNAQETLEGVYDVALGDHAVYVRVHGLAGMTNCLCMRDFLERMLAAGRTFIVVDLAACTGMDSTFMGVLAGAASYESPGKPVGVAVVNAGPQLVKLLEEIGLNELLFIEPKPFTMPEVNFVRLEGQPGEEERLQLIKSAHEHLIKVSANNERVFGPLVAVLREEMRRRGIGS